MLLMEQIESGSPGESGSGGRAAALPVQERDSPPSPTSPQALGSPPARGRRGWDSRVWGLSTEVQRAPTLTCPPLARRASCGCSAVKEHQPAPDRGEEKDGTLGALASLGTWRVAGQGQIPVSRVPPKRPRTPGATGQTQDQGKVSEALPRVQTLREQGKGHSQGESSFHLAFGECGWHTVAPGQLPALVSDAFVEQRPSVINVRHLAPAPALQGPCPFLRSCGGRGGGGRQPSSERPGSPRTEPRLFATWQCRRPKGGRSRTRAQRRFSEAGSGTGAALGFLRSQPSGSGADVTLTGVPATGETSTWQGPDDHSSGRTPSPVPVGELSSAVLAP